MHSVVNVLITKHVSCLTKHCLPGSGFYVQYIGMSAICPCGSAPQTAEHLLQDCIEHNILRQLCWPRQTTVTAILYEPLRELKTTVEYVQETALQIQKFISMRTKEEEDYPINVFNHHQNVPCLKA